MDRIPSHDHDCARCTHRTVYGLNFIDDLELGILAARFRPTNARSLLSTPGGAAAAHCTATDIAVECNPVILENIGHRIIEVYGELEAGDRERQGLVQELNERKGARELFKEEQLDHILGNVDISVTDMKQRVEKILAECEKMMPEIWHVQQSLIDVVDEENELLEELHELRLRRGCTCCNAALRRFGTVIDAILEHGTGQTEDSTP